MELCTPELYEYASIVSHECPTSFKMFYAQAYLDLEKLVKVAWNESYLVTRMIKINANTRVRRVSSHENWSSLQCHLFNVTIFKYIFYF